MLSNEVLSILRKSVGKLATNKILVPFAWDETKTKLRVKSGKKELFSFRIYILVEVVVFGSIFAFGPEPLVSGSDSFSEIVMPIMGLICIYLAVNLQLGLFVCRHDIAVFVNKYLQYEEMLRRKFVLKLLSNFSFLEEYLFKLFIEFNFKGQNKA
jgi:hypothetical protein